MKIKQRKKMSTNLTAGKLCDRRKNACKFVHSAIQKFHMNNVRLLSLIRTKRCDIWLVRDTSLLQKSWNDSPPLQYKYITHYLLQFIFIVSHLLSLVFFFVCIVVKNIPDLQKILYVLCLINLLSFKNLKLTKNNVEGSVFYFVSLWFFFFFSLK